jgi:5-methylcytosine-specific restriction endonuclease McrA
MDREVDKDLNRKVRARDKMTCQLCKKKKTARTLQIHHIVRWADNPGLRYDIHNLICLCKKCHWDIRNKESIYAPYFAAVVSSKNPRK